MPVAGARHGVDSAPVQQATTRDSGGEIMRSVDFDLLEVIAAFMLLDKSCRFRAMVVIAVLVVVSSPTEPHRKVSS